MSCPRTEYLIQEYLNDDPAPAAAAEIDRHLAQCADCRAELDAILQTRQALAGWRAERVPHWDRGRELFRREHRVSAEPRGRFGVWQWLPTAASFAMLCLMLFNTTVVSTGQGFEVSFGGRTAAPELDARLAEFAVAQEQELQSMITRFETRQDSNNLQLLQAVMEQTQQTTSENLERIYAYFEEQRLQDLQDMRSSYQQLVDSDYQTIRSLEQLARYVSFEGEVR